MAHPTVFPTNIKIRSGAATATQNSRHWTSIPEGWRSAGLRARLNNPTLRFKTTPAAMVHTRRPLRRSVSQWAPTVQLG